MVCERDPSIALSVRSVRIGGPNRTPSPLDRTPKATALELSEIGGEPCLVYSPSSPRPGRHPPHAPWLASKNSGLVPSLPASHLTAVPASSALSGTATKLRRSSSKTLARLAPPSPFKLGNGAGSEAPGDIPSPDPSRLRAWLEPDSPTPSHPLANSRADGVGWGSLPIRGRERLVTLPTPRATRCSR